jgi:hypothetical protein
MKLILCTACNDVLSLRREARNCLCGQSGGHYLEDGLHARIWGNCIPIGIANDSLLEAIRERPAGGLGVEFTAFVMPKVCLTIEVIQHGETVTGIFENVRKKLRNECIACEGKCKIGDKDCPDCGGKGHY